MSKFDEVYEYIEHRLLNLYREEVKVTASSIKREYKIKIKELEHILIVMDSMKEQEETE